MKKKINLTVVAALLLIILQIFTNSSSLKAGAIHETGKPGEFLRKWSSENASVVNNTLILLDLDDTCISTPDDSWLGSSVMFYQLLDQEVKRAEGKTVDQAIDYIHPLMQQMQEFVPVALTDDQLPRVVSDLVQQGIIVLGFTAREDSLIPLTLDQLKKTGLHFSQLIGDNVFTLENKAPIHTRKGVVFVGRSKKGDAVAELLASGRLPYHPSKILLMDDRQEHLESTQKALREYHSDIDFISVLSTYPQKHHQNYQDSAAREELLYFLHQHHEKKAIQKLIKTDPFTYDIMSKQCTGLPPVSPRRAICEKLANICPRSFTGT